MSILFKRLLFSKEQQEINVIIFNIKINASLFLSLYKKIKSLKDHVTEYSTFIVLFSRNVLFFYFLIFSEDIM